ncbi:YihY/virulence factor BrkB family protein [Sphingomonas sp.]|jgi:membrane protein|uniref:YihY/virulence factor BrkB family protein n=1 Tax=Sphingomonas sp. TaxID=28214 RepID=UPI002E2FFA38|nr:YihY/virulence factor BrkB family protein [Sphingomonas sp.]HEX4695655.1 YihY/virulence factor BrkB family protein [Sphingomonas sp.]
MSHISPLSPEARAERGYHERRGKPVWERAWIVTKRVFVGIFANGFMYAGNLAYLALMTVFPFFILAAAIASVFGQRSETVCAVNSFLYTLPPSAGELLRKPISDVLAARTGSLLILGAVVALWTVGSFVETIRDVFRRAYGVTLDKPFWRYRLGSMLVIIGSVVLALLAFLIQGVLTIVEQFIYHWLPWAEEVAGWIGLSRLVPGLIMYGALYMLFLSVTPGRYRGKGCPRWPGALFTTVWWIVATLLLPATLGLFGGYDLTYGSLAGVIVTLLFFWIIGFGISIGAHLNAALAETPLDDVRESGTSTEAVAT